MNIGNEVATLVNESKTAGSYEVEFDGSKTSKRNLFLSIESWRIC